MINNLKMWGRLHRERRQSADRGRRRGVAMLVMALATIFIFGCASLAVDYGLLVNDKNKWQNGVDAAALAGAQELQKGDAAADTANARRVAKAVALENGVTVQDSGITFLDENKKIRVQSANVRSLYFAQVIGFKTGTVNAFAVAGTNTPTYGVPRPVPISITYTTALTRRAMDGILNPILGIPLLSGLLKPVDKVDSAPLVITIPRVQEEPYGLNQFLVFDLRSGGKSPSQMSDQLIAGYPDVFVGDLITSLNASSDVVDKNFTPPIAERFQKSAQPPWNDTWTGNVGNSTGIRYNDIMKGVGQADNPRIMNLIVNSPLGANNGTTKHKILAFVPVYVESWDGNQMTVRFLPDSLFGGENSGTMRKVSLLQ